MASILTMNAQNLVPGQGGPEYETQSNQVWFGRWDQQVITGGILDKDTVDAGNTDATTLIRHGLALGIISASNQFALEPLCYGRFASSRRVLHRSRSSNVIDCRIDR
jgi:hypothetical protein